MPDFRFTTSIGAAMLVAALAACSSSTSPSNSSPAAVSDQQVSTDVANDVSSDAAGDVQQFQQEGSGGTNFGVMAGSAVTGQTTCGPSTVFQATFYFGADLQDTITYSRTREFFEGGACALSWSPSTDSIEYVGTWDVHEQDKSGKWTRDADRLRNASVAGTPSLDSATSHVWNANALVHDTIQFVGAVNTRHYAGVAYDTAASVTFKHPRDGEFYPESGTWTRWATWQLNVTGAKTKSETVQRHVVVTFNGSQFVPLNVYNIETGQIALTCTLDLFTHRIRPGSCVTPTA
jgi:hypothetical protein